MKFTINTVDFGSEALASPDCGTKVPLPIGYARSLVMFLLLFRSFLDAKEATVEQLFNVVTIQVKEVSYAKTMKSYGFIKVDDSRVYDVTPRFGGYVDVLYGDKMYQRIKKGAILAKVYSPEVLKAKDDYLNTMRFTKKNPNKEMLQSSKTKLELLNISQSEIDTLTQTGKSSYYTSIVSPADGYIFEKHLNNNSAFNKKNKLFKIVNLDKVWVEVKIHQDQLSLLKDVKEFSLTTSSYTQSFGAKRMQLYPELDEKQESFTLRLELENKKHLLKPGMYTKVVMRSNKQRYLTLPNTAVIRKNGTFYVFIVGEYEGEYEPLEVEVEILNPDTYNILSGLEVGDEVVNNALFMMDSDAQINGLY